MKTLLLIAVSTALAAGLGGCASTSTPVSVTPEARPQPNGSSWARDESRIARIEEQARRRGVAVQWVNLPMKRKASALREQ
ncbi:MULTISPECIES: hypothetical protein [Luteimonas]|uniref:hypothetical protein n=1 Tax=Luteimonas TaxID=83614 RepID=UPI000C7B3252|nr:MULTISPECIES: hypothetical protein [Luteimonas]